MSAFEKSTRLLEDAQSLVLNWSTPEQKQVRTLYHYTLCPLLHLWRGLKVVGISFFIWSIYFIAMYYIVEIATSASGISADLSWIVLIAPFVFVLFATPSTYSNSGVREQEVLIGQALSERRILNLAEIDTVLDYIEDFEGYVDKRIRKMRWGVAALWGIFIYTLQVYFGLLLETPLTNVERAMEEFTPLIGTILLIVLGALIAVEAYAVTKNKVFKVARYALFEARLDKQAEG